MLVYTSRVLVAFAKFIILHHPRAVQRMFFFEYPFPELGWNNYWTKRRCSPSLFVHSKLYREKKRMFFYSRFHELHENYIIYFSNELISCGISDTDRFVNEYRAVCKQFISITVIVHYSHIFHIRRHYSSIFTYILGSNVYSILSLSYRVINLTE